MGASARRRRGFTLIEVLIGIALIAILCVMAIEGYIGFIQRAREAAVIQYIRDIHKGQQEWRMETDALGYTGDFDELEETGFIPLASNYTRVRTRTARRTARETESSSRLYQTYKLDLQAISTPSTNAYTYSLTAYPQNGARTVRWFYIDQTGVIRTAKGWANRGAPPI